MSASQSNLSDPKYGYDIVVATTQASINATMKVYLDTVPQPVIVACFGAGTKVAGQPTPIVDMGTDMPGCVDPFCIPKGTDPNSSADIKKLKDVKFRFAIRAKMGIPPGYAPDEVPDIVRLKENNDLIFVQMCSEFEIVQYIPASEDDDPTWLHEKQQPGQAWLFESMVKLDLNAITNPDFASLPKDVQDQMKNLGKDAFSVQQLLINLNNAKLQGSPKLLTDGLRDAGMPDDSPVISFLRDKYQSIYLQRLKEKGNPVLAYNVVDRTPDNATLKPTDLNFWITPFMGANRQRQGNPSLPQQDLATLNYLCMTNGKSLPARAEFNWNWVEEGRQADFHGAIAVNRNTFANWFRTQLDGYVRQNCYIPSCSCSWTKNKFTLQLPSGGNPSLDMPASGPIVLSYSYFAEAEDKSGPSKDDQIHPKTWFNLSIKFEGNAITITQKLVVNLYIQRCHSGDDGNVVNKEVKEVYRLAVDGQGKLNLVPEAPVVTDHPDNPNINAFSNIFLNFNKMGVDFGNMARAVAARSFTSFPLQKIQSFVFPGGKTFAFKDAAFSENQDLIAHITYVDPSLMPALKPAVPTAQPKPAQQAPPMFLKHPFGIKIPAPIPVGRGS